MSDDVRAEIKAAAKALCHYPSGPHAANSCCSGIGRCEMSAAIEEITRLRAELATARRDALAEIKQDTDEAIELGRQDGMEYAAQWHDEQAAKAQRLSDMKVSALDSKVWGDYATNHREYAAAIRALSDTPSGMVLVPREPTAAMIQAGFLVKPQAFKHRIADWWPSDVKAIYSAMVKATEKGEGNE